MQELFQTITLFLVTRLRRNAAVRFLPAFLLTFVVLLASIDSGTTWLPSIAVNDVPSTFNKGSYGSRLGWLGDTAGLTADSKGVFHPVWIDNRTGIKQVFTASILVKLDRLSGSR